MRRASALFCIAALLGACGSDGDDEHASAPAYAVLSAFPAELAAVLEHVEVEQTTVVDGRTVRLGRLGGARVVVAMTGIGLLNAAMTSTIVLDNFAVDGVIVSGVAGSPYRIGDVVVPESWAGDDGQAFAADPRWLRLARGAAAGDAGGLARCTMVPSHSPDPVCLGFAPAIIVGGAGHSSDSFGNTPFKCQPAGGDVFGCDIAQPRAALARGGGLRQTAAPVAAAADPVSSDMETAAIGRAAAAHGLPYIAFRADSDGAEDPLGLPGFPTQFFAYYPLAAHNAAAAAASFIERLAR
ncbi:MAG: hypothetical protein ABI629_14220 [bacterium]